MGACRLTRKFLKGLHYCLGKIPKLVYTNCVIQPFTLNRQLEAEISARTANAKEKERLEKHLRNKSFEEFSRKMIDSLFEVFAKRFNKHIQRRQQEPICVTAATNKLIAYCLQVVDNAMPKNRPRSPRGIVAYKHSEQKAKVMVAQVLALLAKRVFIDNARMENC